MATAGQIAKAKRQPKFTTRQVNRCWNCGRRRGFMRRFKLCRICFREFANAGKIPGIRKASW